MTNEITSDRQTESGNGMVRPSAPGRSAYIWMYVSQAVVAVVGLLVYRWAGTNLGTEGFAEYALARRAATLLSPALLLGLGIAVTRSVAQYDGAGDRREVDGRFWSAATMVLLLHVVLAALLLLAKGFFAGLFFGDDQRVYLIGPTLLLLVGISWHGLVWAFLRGLLRLKFAAGLEMVNMGAIPLTVVLVLGRSAGGILGWTGGLMALVCLGLTIRMAFGSRARREDLVPMGRGLLSYGLPRVPGDFALGGLLSIPSLITAHLYGVELGGFVAFGATMLALAGTALSPLGTALLPQAVHYLREGRVPELRRHVYRLLTYALLLGVAGVLVAEIGMDVLIRLYLGPDFAAAVPVLRTLAFCAVPYAVFYSLRSVVDAAYHRPINTRNVFIALAVFLVLVGMFHLLAPGLLGIYVGSISAHSVLALLTWWEVRRILQRPAGHPVIG